MLVYQTHDSFSSLHLRIAIFGVEVLREERIVVVAEQRPDCTEDEVPQLNICTLDIAFPNTRTVSWELF